MTLALLFAAAPAIVACGPEGFTLVPATPEVEAPGNNDGRFEPGPEPEPEPEPAPDACQDLCQEGIARCAAETLEVCTPGDDGCLRFEAKVNCAASGELCGFDAGEIGCWAPPATCSDGQRNGDESDVDCGGGCWSCDAGDSCDAHGDCESGHCFAGTCQAPMCGDGFLSSDEGCDDGTDNGPACAYGETSCTVCTDACQLAPGTVSMCGDGIVDENAGEACDDGNTAAGDYCSADCTEVTGACGDGLTQANEHCDDAGDPSEACNDTCDGGVCFVNMVGDGPSFTTLQPAIDNEACDPIRIGPGTYAGQLVAERNVRLLGENAATTVIDAQGLGRVLLIVPDEELPLDDAIHTHAGSVIEGLTLRGGLAAEGGGVFAEGVKLTVADSVFESNVADCDGSIDAAGGAIAIEGVLFLEDSEIRDNEAQCPEDDALGGGIVVSGGLQVRRTSFTNNRAVCGEHAEGGAVMVDEVEGVVPLWFEDVVFDSNEALGLGAAGGALLVDERGHLTLRRVDFIANRSVGTVWDAEGGGASIEDVVLDMEDARFIDNVVRAEAMSREAEGGGLMLDDLMRNSGGGAAAPAEVSRLVNVVFEGNTASALADSGEALGGALVIEHSDGPVLISQAAFIDNEANAPAGEAAGGGAVLKRNPAVSIANTTMVGNAANGESSAGGALFVDGMDEGEQLTLAHITATANTAQFGALLAHAIPSPDDPAALPVVLRGVLAWGHDTFLINDLPGVGVAMVGPSLLEEVPPGVRPEDAPLIVMDDPLLGALTDEGETPPYLPLLSGSPAVDMAGACASTLSGDEPEALLDALSVDQIGAPRDDGSCDLGAIEMP